MTRIDPTSELAVGDFLGVSALSSRTFTNPVSNILRDAEGKIRCIVIPSGWRNSNRDYHFTPIFDAKFGVIEWTCKELGFTSEELFKV